MRYLVCTFILGVAAGLCEPAEAGLMASFTANGMEFRPAPINVGDTLNVPLYLRWDGPGDNILVSPGLLSAGIRVMFDPAILSVDDGMIVSGFRFAGSSVTWDNIGGTAVVQGVSDLIPPVTIPPGSLSMLIGELVFRGLAGGISSLTLSDPGPETNTIVARTDDDPQRPIDSEINFSSGVGSITVNDPNTGVVPEPTSLGLFGVGIIAALFSRNRRQRLTSRKS